MPGARRIVVILIIIALLASIAYLIIAGLQLAGHARAALDAAGRLRPALSGNQLNLRAAASNLSQIERELGSLQHEGRLLLGLAPALRWLPFAGNDLAAAPTLLEMGRALASAGAGAADALAPALEVSADRGLPAILAGLRARRADLARVAEDLDRAQRLRQSLDVSWLSPRLKKLVALFDANLPAAQAAAAILPALPDLLGQERPRTYLLLAQNNEELRATGGFISGVGEITLAGGALTGARFMDSYAVDDLTQPQPPAPAALKRYMYADYMLLRDANWDPDFPTSARAILSLYQLDQGVAANGVIAADLTAIGWLAGALGPLHVEGVEGEITADNYMQMLMAAWEAPPAGAGQDWWKHRKDFMGALFGTALTQMLSKPAQLDWMRVASALRMALDEKHLLIYLDDAQLMARLRAAGWDGSMPGVAGDYVMVVDSNVGFNKVNALVERQTHYHVWLDVAPRAELQLTYRHMGVAPLAQCVHEARYGESYDDMRQRCYWDYVRLYLPAGAQIEHVEGFEPDSAEPPAIVGDKLVIAGLIILPPGAERVVRLGYTLPAGVYRDQTYRLDISKQPGTSHQPAQIMVEDATCRAGLRSAQEEAISFGAWLRYAIEARRDVTLEVSCHR
jgi:hypothetical protein